MNGVRRGKGARTTVPAKDGRCSGDSVLVQDMSNTCL